MFKVLQPWFLLLLLAIPLVWWSAKRVRVLGRGRKAITLFLRSLVFTLLTLALAEVVYQHTGDTLTVFFVIDRSASIPQDEQQFSLAYVEQQLGKIPKDDRAGIIFFGKTSAIQDNPREDIKLLEYQTLINQEGTDIEGAIGLAMAAFPEETQKRIVLLTDGNQTQGNAEPAAQRAKANGIDLRVMPLEYSYTQDALVEDVVLPGQIKENEPFNVKVLVSAQEEGPAKLRLTENGTVVAEQEVTLKPGKNAFSIPRKIDKGGFYTFDATVEAENDSRPSNNRAQNFSVIQGTPRVLLLESEPREGQYLAAALASEGIEVDYHTPEYLPGSLQEMQIYDSVILSNVSAAEISDPQLQMLELAVRDLGIGLIMIGGPESFGSGGYLNTPVERALPLTMDVKQQRVIPSGALALIMHSMEIPQGNHWAKEISIAALDILSPSDYMGFLYFNSMGGGNDWLFELQKVGDKQDMRQTLMTMPTNTIGDMPDFVSTMDTAATALEKVQANKKHIVILSDGDPQRPTSTMLQEIRDMGITISTVCINPHSPMHVDIMKAIAELGGGNAYHVQDNKNLPKIFIKEASIVRKNLVVEKPFTPVVTGISDIIEGFNEGFPQLDGYVASSAKPEAQLIMVSDQDDPLLAQWRYGLGKAVAFTSDAKSRWAGNWLNWEGYSKFWSQLVRWTIREKQQDNYQIVATTEGDNIKVMVDALDEEGGFVNDLDFTASAIDPLVKSKNFTISQTQPGRYEGTFPVSEAGSYLISMTYNDQEGDIGNITTGVSVPYSPEHNTTHQNDSVIKRIADVHNKAPLTMEENVFLHDLPAAGEVTPLWPQLLGWAIALFFFDIAVRRVYFELPAVQRFFARIWERIMSPFSRRMAPVGPATEELGKLMQAKVRASYPEQRVQTQRESFAQKLDSVDDAKIDEIESESGKPSTLWHELPKDVKEPPKFDDQEQDTYTNALFRAKQRAQDKLKEK